MDIEQNHGIKLRSGKVLLPIIEPILKWDYVSEGLTKFLSSFDSESVEECSEKKVSSKIDVPNGFGEEAGKYLEILNRSYQDCEIGHNQLHELVRGFSKFLNYFPDDVPQEKIKKFCKEAYDHVLWKSFVDEEITRRQFVDLM